MRILLLGTALMAGSVPQAVNAQDHAGVWFVGGSLSDSGSGYGGVVYSLPGSRLGDGLAIRTTVNGGQYRYQAAEATINGEYVGGEVALVVQSSGQWGWANFSVGPRISDTSLTPADPANTRTGTRFDVGLQGDGTFYLSAFRTHWYGAFGPFEETYNGRLQVGRRFKNSRFELGVDGRLLGDPSFSQKALGVYLMAPLVDQINLEIGAGAIWQEGENEDGYISLGVSSVF